MTLLKCEHRLSEDGLFRRRASRRKSTAKGKKKARAAGKCGQCRKRKPKRGMQCCSVCQKKSRDKYRANPEAALARIKVRRAALRDIVFNALGGPKCKCCGEEIIEFLEIDHINDDGHHHRKQIGNGGTAIHRWLIRNKFPSGFQVLCRNCNFAKSAFGKCPHNAKKK